MHSHETMQDHMSHNIPHQHLVNTVHHCAATCEHMGVMMTKTANVHLRDRQLQLLRDCADICHLAVKYLSRNSIYVKQLVALCACVCETCGRECSRFPDAESQHCARVCLHCARECQEFATMY